MEERDVIVIGSGMAGMTCAIYLKRGGLNPLVIEEGVPGGQLNKINVIDNYPGFIHTDGPTLGSEVYSQVENLDIEYLYDKVTKAELSNDEKILYTAGGKIISCKYLVIATGRLSKKLFNDDDRYAGKGISYCALCDGNLYKGLDVAVVGAGSSAMEEALYLADICKSVTMIIRGEELTGDQSLINDINNKNNIKCVYNSNVTEYNIENGKLTSVTLDSGSTIEVNGLFISIGSVPSASIFDVEKDKGFIIVDNECMTNVENVYACGDVIKKNVYQLTTAAGEGTTVAYSIIRKTKK